MSRHRRWPRPCSTGARFPKRSAGRTCVWPLRFHAASPGPRNACPIRALCHDGATTSLYNRPFVAVRIGLTPFMLTIEFRADRPGRF